MKISALEEYGLRCMVRLAKEGAGGSLSLSEIGEAEGLSFPYAAKLFGLLKSGGVVIAERGRNGGYSLSRPASQIRLKEVFDALGEPLFGANHCERFQSPGSENKECIHHDDCTVRDIWSSFGQMINGFLHEVTLENLVSRQSGKRSDLFEIAGIKMGFRGRDNRIEQTGSVQA